ncbi:protein arginine N-methyltransferase 9-like [Cimex lectularius]|uniref:Protein arginine N-methyltransferase domain-containing protein n=1 Tax=Cimex lectularius TaxID=79782 RepID=A0A8I6RSN2_CIMLE|nr:protein arginine N-methyltransferase 9-like [Cimex lectularius]
MQKQSEDEVAVNSINLAQYYEDKDIPGRSFAHFLVALKLKPEWKQQFKTDFLAVLYKFGLYLQSEERFEDLFACYEEAIETYPGEKEILTNLGGHLIRIGFVKEARKYFKSALERDENYLPAFHNFQSATNLLVEKWHFKMLNDSFRNKALKESISKMIKNGSKNVIDIGTGTGLLSLYAIKEGAENVFACEYSEAMYDIAGDVFSKNNVKNKVKLLKNISNNLMIPNDIPFRCSLVVSEIVDAGLFGEGILQTLIHAWNNLIVRPEEDGRSGNVIPLRATLFAAPIQCLSVARKYMNLPKIRKKPCQDLSPLSLSHLNNDPYDLEYLKYLDYELLSDPIELFNVDFTSVKNMEDHLNGANNLNVTFNCKQGFLDGFAAWFDLYLDEENKISSSPLSQDYTCWGQAIFPCYTSYYLKTDDQVSTYASCTNGKLVIRHNKINEIDVDTKKLINIEQSAIRYINSSSLLNFMYDAIADIKHKNDLLIVDLSPFPYGGIQFLNYNSKVICINKSGESLKKCTKTLLNSNSLIVKTWEEYILHDFEKMLFDVIVVDLLHTIGELSENNFSQFIQLRTKLKPNGIIIPSCLNFWCQLIYSEQLAYEHKVYDANLDIGDFKIADVINEYKTSTHIEIDASALKFTKLSDKIPIGSLNLKTCNCQDVDIFQGKIHISQTGKVNAILHGYSYQYGDHLYDSSSHDSHVYQAAEMLIHDITVNENDSIVISCLHSNGITKYSIVNDH